MLEFVGVYLVLEEKFFEKNEDFVVYLGEDVVFIGFDCQVKLILVIVFVIIKKGLSFDLEGEKIILLKWKLDEVDEQVVCQEVKVSVVIEEDLEFENGILEFEIKSSKFV